LSSICPINIFTTFAFSIHQQPIDFITMSDNNSMHIEQISESDSNSKGPGEEKPIIPDGIPKSGRIWKKKQIHRASAQRRQGVLKHLCKSYDERKQAKERDREIREFEKSLKEESNKKKEAERLRRDKLVFKRLENENKAAVYQEVIIF
jgi:hypothetical protein